MARDDDQTQDSAPERGRSRDRSRTPERSSERARSSTQAFLSIGRDGRVSFKVGTLITIVATALASGGSVGGLTLLDQLTGPSQHVIELEDRIKVLEKDKLEKDKELKKIKVLEKDKLEKDKQLKKALDLAERNFNLVLRVHKIETTIDGRPVDLDHP